MPERKGRDEADRQRLHPGLLLFSGGGMEPDGVFCHIWLLSNFENPERRKSVILLHCAYAGTFDLTICGLFILRQDRSFGEHNPVDRMAAFLKEMAGLAGQGDQPAVALELQFGDVQTVTMLDPEGKAPELSISAQLPRDERLAYSQMSISDGMASPSGAPDTTCLWHADEGRYVMVRRIPLRELPDERSVFDAILDTADLAEQWYAFLCARLARPH